MPNTNPDVEPNANPLSDTTPKDVPVPTVPVPNAEPGKEPNVKPVRVPNTDPDEEPNTDPVPDTVPKDVPSPNTESGEEPDDKLMPDGPMVPMAAVKAWCTINSVAFVISFPSGLPPNVSVRREGGEVLETNRGTPFPVAALFFG